MEDYTNINWDSIAKGVAGELSPEELLQMQNELKDAPEAENIMKEINDIWDAVEYADELKEINTDAAWIAVKEDISRRSRWRKKRTFISIAATLVLLLGSYLTLHYLGFYGTETLVANNGIANVELIDGTKVDLNIGSELKYPQAFDENERRIQLKGEAFFKVARDENKPFVIEAGDIEIKVLGTSFNVNTYKRAKNSIVIVEIGKVLVTAIESRDTVELTVGEMAVFNPQTGKLEFAKNKNLNYNSWATRQLEFNKSSLDEVFKVLEDVYHVGIDIDSSVHLDEKVLTASFNNHSLEHILKSVCLTFNYNFTLNADKTQVLIKK